jgi:hypothetical protein
VKYTFTCPEDNEVMTVDAMTDDEAMMKMMEMAKEHFSSMHADKPMMSDEEMGQMITDGWTKA